MKNKRFTSEQTRSFSSTPRRKGDPLFTTSIAFASPYAASLLCNPLGAAFILLMGMATTLFFLTLGLPGFFALNPPLGLVLQRLDNIFLLSETYLSYEQNGINILLSNIGNFSPETLNNYYLSLQELITVRESLFSNFNNAIMSPQVEALPEVLADRANHIFEEFRLSGNNLISLIRDIEGRLNIPENERIPSF